MKDINMKDNWMLESIMPLLADGTIVTFKFGEELSENTGVVRGIACTGIPFLGRGYIVEFLNRQIVPECYQYSCIVVYELNIIEWISY